MSIRSCDGPMLVTFWLVRLLLVLILQLNLKNKINNQHIIHLHTLGQYHYINLKGGMIGVQKLPSH